MTSTRAISLRAISLRAISPRAISLRAISLRAISLSTNSCAAKNRCKSIPATKSPEEPLLFCLLTRGFSRAAA